MNERTEFRDIAVFWDFQNIGLKRGTSFANDILEFLDKKGRVVAAYAYADWCICSSEAASVLQNNRYQLLHVPNPTKNSADVLMTAHAMAHLTSAPTIMEYVLISKDYDFRPLVSNLQRMGKRMTLICRPVDTNPDFLSMVDSYIDTQEIRSEVAKTLNDENAEHEDTSPSNEDTERKSAFAQLQETVREIEARGNQTGIGYREIVMTSLNPGFDEIKLGFARWGDFVGAAANEGFITLDDEGAGTLLGLPKRITRAGRDSIDLVQGGFEFLVRTVQNMEKEEKSMELGLIASKMHCINPTFKPADLGFRKFFDFVKAAEQRGLIEIEIVAGKQPMLRLSEEKD